MACRRILVVDDDPNTVELEGDLLRGAGHHVFSAQSTLAAVQTLQQRDFDVLLTDLCINDPTDGFVLAALFKRMNPAGTTILSTGSADISVGLNDFQRQLDFVLVKPTASVQLLDAVAHSRGSGPSAGRQSLAGILALHQSQIVSQWMRSVEADPVLQSMPADRRSCLLHMGVLVEAVIACIAVPEAEPEAAARFAHLRHLEGAHADHAAAHHRQGCSPVVVVLELMHLHNALNSSIRANLVLVNLGTLGHDILTVNEAIASATVDLLRTIGAE